MLINVGSDLSYDTNLLLTKSSAKNAIYSMFDLVLMLQKNYDKAE